VVYLSLSSQAIQCRIIGWFMDYRVKNRILRLYRSTITAYS
jgi:hypothetical protein